VTAAVAQVLSPELAELIGMIGSERVIHLLKQFLPELDACDHALLTATDAKPSAHRLTAQAGFLGFNDLSARARDVEHGLTSHDRLQDEIVATREQVLDLIASLSEPA
jgi:HPt (histidine-containing phosphotransfer) domain-containing protein